MRGRKLADVVGPQLEAALSLQPDLVSAWSAAATTSCAPRPTSTASPPGSRPPSSRIRRDGADVLWRRPTDPADAPLVKATARPARDPHRQHLLASPSRNGAHVINQWGLDALRDWRMWSEDRIHMTTEGHRRVALAALAALGHTPTEADWATPCLRADRGTRREELRGHAAWARTYAGPWVQRRLQGRSSGDTVTAKRPELTPVEPARAVPELRAPPAATSASRGCCGRDR